MLWRGLRTLLIGVVLISGLLAPASNAFGDDSDVTARLGISAGEAIEDAQLGATGDALREMIPLLWETADKLNVHIMSASVGQGFWSDDGELESEKDLDLVVAGLRDDIEELAAILGPAWDQRSVLIWYSDPELGRQPTATIPLTGGATELTDEVYRAVVDEITDGAHVKYADSESLLFIAKTDDKESDAAFYLRMTRLIDILSSYGVQTGPMVRGRADVSVVTKDARDRHTSSGLVDIAA